MFDFFQNLRKSKPKTKPIKEQVLSLPVGSYVVVDLNPDICFQLKRNGSPRYDESVLVKNQVKGLVKSVYKTDNTNTAYFELVGVVVNGEIGSRREYVVMENEVVKLNVMI